MDTAHTPLPWWLEDCSNGGAILRREGTQSHLQVFPEADARLIVTTVNHHAELVAALEACVSNHCRTDKMFCSTCTPARALLARIQGTP